MTAPRWLRIAGWIYLVAAVAILAIVIAGAIWMRSTVR